MIILHVPTSCIISVPDQDEIEEPVEPTPAPAEQPVVGTASSDILDESEDADVNEQVRNCS